MMNSKELFVWVWLPDQVQPVVAAKLTMTDTGIYFTYAKSYLNNPLAIALYDKELPLKAGVHENKLGKQTIPSCIRDAAPDAWGRRVILNKLLGKKGRSADTIDLDEFTYLIESGSDRIGGLDFQESSNFYQPRLAGKSTLEQLLRSAELIEKGMPLSQELAQAIHHGTSIGGARPKALIEDENKKYIAKFSSSADQFNIIKAEFIAMKLAKLAGLNVANVSVVHVSGKDVLLVERFDRETKRDGLSRKIMLSALTLLELDEMTPHYASYEDFAEIIRHRFHDPKNTLSELFGRIVFNILCGNTDDHARNHAAFWDGKSLCLTPAYDICPQLRSGGEATQAMLIVGQDRRSRLATCLGAAEKFLLSKAQANEIIQHQVQTIKTYWKATCDEAELSPIDRTLFWERMFLHPYAFQE